MKKSIAACAAFALVLMGCAGPKGYKSFDVAAANEVHVSVKVVADLYIIVNQEPVYVKQGDDNTLYWHLDPAGPYFFADSGGHKGIKFTSPPPPPPGHRCDRDATDTKTYICTYRRAPRGKFVYQITVTKDGTNFLESDPTGMNN